MHPSLVTSPAKRIRNLGRWYIDPRGWWSVREMEWLDEDGVTWNHAIGCRWNGDLNNQKEIGHPNSFNNAVWFILPEPFSQMAAALIEAAGVQKPIGDLAVEPQGNHHATP